MGVMCIRMQMKKEFGPMMNHITQLYLNKVLKLCLKQYSHFFDMAIKLNPHSFGEENKTDVIDS